MSQMPQQAALSNCPSCAEPLLSGDRFCEKCGYDLSASAETPSADRPAAVNGSVAWPHASEPDSSDTPPAVHLPTDLQGTESDGRGAPQAGQRAVSPDGPGGVRFDRAPEPDEYPLQAPDPRIAPEQQPAPAKVCVACRAGRVDHDGYCENCGHAQPRERDHMEQECGPVAAVSDRGLRHHRNEDSFAVGCTALADGSPAVLAIVCDGVSSATRPDEASLAASRAATDTLLAALPHGTHPQQAMHEAIVAASRAVNALAGEPATAREHAPHQNAPACTLVGAVITSGLLVVGWVGDSRAYWVPVDRSAPPARLTEDDSWAAQMVAAGLMNEAEAYADERAHAITGWLGADAYELEPHTASFKPDRPGVVVVCTDGLWNYAEAAEEMADVVPLDAAVRPLHSAQVLVGHALDGGGHDNVTVAVLPFPAPPMGAGSA
ncbi:magnesium or manganese-dependent protein phosphatase [Streptomyces davaonensis JCM 4913]|uniref:Magnesium or manganese-dependent protein phosphatase n=1 Tax=Streptomyces davaonensis (strain DSM 101723 / JCM 4913 / KCC S-0913 / 768) TaxID=1214101 RepID=K4R123_STRDJ|nr:protein phosphatase 2C domain-containing protein [Streptomyces davaonensis]CCK29991.1 magnesium or manganese-dependent protein phosphatase [Streptomyces davaonensis JCM 4913]